MTIKTMRRAPALGSAAVFAAFAWLASARPAAAQVWAESADAGDLPASAQIVSGFTDLFTITGVIGPTLAPPPAGSPVIPDVDLFGIYLTGGATFSATTVGLPGNLFDSQLFLFDANGFGVYASDDDPSALGARSTLPAFSLFTPQSAGLYYLGISAFTRDPISTGGLIFPETPFTGVVGPTGPGGAGSITGYSGATVETQVSYTIRLTGARAAFIPEPGTTVLLLGALVSSSGPLLWARRNRRKMRAANRSVAST